jgi:hypothetical protein
MFSSAWYQVRGYLSRCRHVAYNPPDPVFAATQDLALKDKGIAKAETMIKACEEELLRLNEIGSSRAARRREDYLLAKMRDAQSSLETLEGDAGELKKVLAKGG